MRTDFYVDDLLSGTDTLIRTQEMQSQLINLLKQGGKELYKSCANNLELLKNISPNADYLYADNVDSHAVKALSL